MFTDICINLWYINLYVHWYTKLHMYKSKPLGIHVPQIGNLWASAMPKSVMSPAAENVKVFKDQKRKNLAVLAETPWLKRFFPAKFLSSNVETVALTKCRWNSRHKFRNTFHSQTGWTYWHVIFPVLMFVIFDFCLLFGWMLFLAESLSTLWKYFFLVRIHCSVYIINSLLAVNCMCSWVSYLFDCKPRLIKFFHHFMRLTIKGGFHFHYFIERYRIL